MQKKDILITGGAGFIGVNSAARFIQEGWSVTLLDNLSRLGGASNLDWLKTIGAFDFRQIDLRGHESLFRLLQERPFDMVLHCAGQVAVTTSVTDPRADFESNLLGTFNILEAVRLHAPKAFFIFASTNKVYGGMEECVITERNGRYEYAGLAGGVSEEQPLDFHSPYGCSKGGADQYTRDYARIYGLSTTAFRQSCIYGYRQFGIEDQGWVAWFMIAHALGREVTIFGDGKQTRDILFIDDLVDSYLAAWEAREKVSGQVYNIGGGPKNQYSLLQLLDFLGRESGRPVKHKFAPPRPGDQRVFVADIGKAGRDFGWQPRHGCEEGMKKLNDWITANLDLFKI